MLESYYKLQLKPKTVPEFKDAIQLIWSALPENVIDNAVKGWTGGHSSLTMKSRQFDLVKLETWNGENVRYS